MIVLIVIVGVAVLALLVLALMYNHLVRLRNRTENAWAQVDVQLRRRYDLVPNLVETVKGYADHEKGLFEEVTKMRTEAQGARGIEEQAKAEKGLGAALGRLMAVAENYPALRATENFQQLQAQLQDTEQKIAVARQVYNDTVQTYDTAIQTVPTNVIAGMFHFTARPYFETEETTRQAPKVEFEKQAEPQK